MKNSLSIIISLLFIASCEVAEVEDLSTLTQPEKDAIYDQIEEPRDVSYLLGTVIDTLSLDIDSTEAQQVIKIIDRSVLNQGAFAVDLAVYQCGVKDQSPQAYVSLLRQSDSSQVLHLKNVIDVSIDNHLGEWWKIDLLVNTDTLFGGVSYTDCSRTLFSRSDYYLTNTISLYGFNENEAVFVKEQLDRLIPQLK